MRLLVVLSLLMLTLIAVAAAHDRTVANRDPLTLTATARSAPAHSQRASRSRHTEPPSRLDVLDWHGLRDCESSNHYRTDTGNGFYGAYQFTLDTWRSVGGTGNPAHASRAEQDQRALILYLRRGRQPWPTCGSRL